MEDVWSNISVSYIDNVLVEFSRTESKFALVGFDDDISKKLIILVYTFTIIYLQSFTIIVQLYDTLILRGGTN